MALGHGRVLGLGRVARARRLAALGAILAIASGAAGCGGGSEPDDRAEGGPPTVEARDFSFAPAELEVAVGEAVTWANTGDELHNVRGRGFFSEAIAPGDSYRHAFREPGRYPYLCTLHPTTMRGVISVARR